ncbi:PREDICTED: zinc finger, partial [Prunus dulcis]
PKRNFLHVFPTKVKKAICEEIGELKFCIIVDEACDESKREQMAIVLRFVDKEAHRLQLALIASSKEIIHVHHFFTKLTFIVNIVGASCKYNDELKNAEATKIEHMIAIDELETEKRMNQIGTLQCAGDT